MPRKQILFVCLGNICRSPTAEGIFRHHLVRRKLEDRFGVDSAGTGDWHVGSPPDRRAQLAAVSRGFDISDLRARQVQRSDFEDFDYLLAMDRGNQQELSRLAGREHIHKIRLLMEFAHVAGEEEVPDPYYGGDSGFDRVIDMIEDASHGLIEHLLRDQ